MTGGGDHPVLELVIHSSIGGIHAESYRRIAVVRMHVIWPEIWPLEPLLQRIAENFFGLLTDKSERGSSWIGLPDDAVDRLYKCFIPQLALSLRSFHPLALSDIHDKRAASVSPALEQRRSNQNRNPAAILTNVFLLKWRAGSGHRHLADRVFIDIGVPGRCEILPTQISL